MPKVSPLKLPELGTDALPRLSWRCTRMLEPIVIDADTWAEWFEVRQ